MAVKVNVGTGQAKVVAKVPGSSGTSVSTTTASRVTTATGLTNLSDVNSTDLEDGYTLVWDEDTGKWIAQAIGDVSANVTAIDGGTF